MAEYIEREALLADFDAAVENNGMGYVIAQTLKRYVKRQPAADVVPVVRCKDCRRMNEDKFCVAWEGFVREDDFCSYGERRDGE